MSCHIQRKMENVVHKVLLESVERRRCNSAVGYRIAHTMRKWPRQASTDVSYELDMARDNGSLTSYWSYERMF